MDSITTSLLSYRPSNDRLEELALEIAEEYGEPSQSYSWLLSDTLPPGHSVHEADQLIAFQRDNPGSVFFTVIHEDE